MFKKISIIPVFRTALLWLFFIVWQTPLFAQVYPVEVMPIVAYPYPAFLNDYAREDLTVQRMQVNLLMRDLSQAHRRVRLKVYVEGPGISVAGSDMPQGVEPLYLDGGILLRLTNAQLAPYFKLENLPGLSAQVYASPLRAGLYTFGFEVYDFATSNRLSAKRLAPLQIVYNLPPMLNLPATGSEVSSAFPQNVMFNWSPRHMDISNTEYEFTLVELNDPILTGEAAFMNTPPFYRQTTMASALVYGPAMPPLAQGKRYAWRVQVKPRMGATYTPVFENDGYSPVFTFTYEAATPAPIHLTATPRERYTALATWQGQPGHTSYTIELRQKPGQEGGNSNWYTYTVTDTQYLFRNLRPGYTYECRVTGYRNEHNHATSETAEFTTPAMNPPKFEGCGTTAQTETITNHTPLEHLLVGDVFTANQTPVTVTTIKQSSGGAFSGYGWMNLPFLGNIRIAVVFNNIMVNTDYQMVAGVVETTYDPTGSGIIDINKVAQGINEVANAIASSIEKLIADIKNKHDKGDITETEYTDITIRIDQAQEKRKEGETKSTQAAEMYKKAEKETDPAKKTEYQQQGEQLQKDAQLAFDQSRNTIREIESLPGMSGNATTASNSTGGFDGEFAWDSSATVQIPVVGESGVTNWITPTQKAENYTICGGNYCIYINTGTASSTEITSKMNAPGQGQFMVWLNYQPGEGKMRYRISFRSSFFGNAINRDEYVSVLKKYIKNNFELANLGGSGLLSAVENLNQLINTNLRPLVAAGSDLTVAELLNNLISFVFTCYSQYQQQTTGIVPRCLWENNLPVLAMTSGFIDAGYDMVVGTVDLSKFAMSWNVASPYFVTPEAAQIRQQTCVFVAFAARLATDRGARGAAWASLKETFLAYLDETAGLDAQASYNQGKIIFNVASFFVGAGELKAMFGSAKAADLLAAKMSQVPKNFAKVLKPLNKLKVKFVKETGEILAADGTKLATFNKVDGALKSLKMADKEGEFVAKLDDVVYGPTGKAETFDLVKQPDGKLGWTVGKVSDEVNELIRGVSKANFKLTFTASEEISEQAWILWKSEKWTELEVLFNKNGINVVNGIAYPPNEGAISIIKKTLDPVEFNNNLIIDRYGSVNGKYTSPVNTPFEKRALPISYANQTPRTFKVIKPIPNVEEGEIIPWFNQPGKGIQYKFEKSIQYYIDNKFIEEIK